MNRKLVACMVIVIVCSLGPAFAQTPRTVLEGVYTPAQAARGETAFGMMCAMCHEGSDPEGPVLRSPDFIDRWREDNLNTLFTHIRTNMPGNAPGSLSANTYLDVLSFLLQSNGIPAGIKELTADVVRSVQLVSKDGPKALPANATVIVVGCVSVGPDDSWILNAASDPLRTRNPDVTTPEELKDSSAKPLGSQTFLLQNAPDNSGDIKGHKVQVKGVLLRPNNNNRISVLSLESVAPSCGQ